MNNILTLNKISKNGLDRFGERYVCSNDVKDPDAILVRSASMHEYDFSENTLAIARAGAGVNNIPLEKCSEQGIVVFNTPGANANAVKELVLCALFYHQEKSCPQSNGQKRSRVREMQFPSLSKKENPLFQDRKSRVKSSALSVLAQSGCL